jgi:hypothetical protein
MGGELNLTDFGTGARIYDGNRALSEPDEHSAGRVVHAHIVGILSQRYRAQRFEVITSVKRDGTVAAVRHGKHAFGDADTLGLVQSGYSVDDLTFVDVDNIDRIIAEFRDEQAASLNIDGEMIDAARHAG